MSVLIAEARFERSAAWLECSGCGRIYNIRDDIPDFLLADPAKDVHPVLRKVRVIDWLAPIYETRLWYPNVLRLAAPFCSSSAAQYSVY